ncbi:MAG: isoprenylcysteine carboxylmethyltransferase family protein [Saprospiraceae bacterium]
MGFTGNLLVPKGIDGALAVPLWQALLTNASLILLFGLQHSIMARSWFKERWTKIVHPAIERSTYVLFASITLLILFYFWQPLGGTVWEVNNPLFRGALWACFGLGYALVFASSFAINHFDLFGLRQVWLYYQKKPYQDIKFRIPVLYRYVRHPLYFGVLLAFWSAGTMSYTRLFFAVFFTIYTLRAITWEEKDLITHFGDVYRKYKNQVPKLIPIKLGKKEIEPNFTSLASEESNPMN